MRYAAVIGIVLLTAGCGPPAVLSPSPASESISAPSSKSDGPASSQSIENWRSEHKMAFRTLGKEVQNLGQALTAGNFDAVHAECPLLGHASQAMREALPSPDARLTAALNDMADHLSSATEECPALTARSDAIDASGFIKDLTAAEHDMSTAEDVMGRPG